MGVIGRTQLYRVMTNGDYPVPEGAAQRWVTPVEDRQMERLGWVPVDQLQGAVEALRELEAMATDWPDRLLVGSKVARIARRGLNAVGGQ